MRAAVLIGLMLVGCGEGSGGPADSAACPPTIDGGTFTRYGTASMSCLYACDSDAAELCFASDASAPAIPVCANLQRDPEHCGRCETRCIRTRDQGGTLDGICEQGRCR